jgi:hypothetical protein
MSGQISTMEVHRSLGRAALMDPRCSCGRNERNGVVDYVVNHELKQARGFGKVRGLARRGEVRGRLRERSGEQEHGGPLQPRGGCDWES